MNNEHRLPSTCPALDVLARGLELGLAETLDHLETCRKCERRAQRIRQDNALARGLSGISTQALSRAMDDKPAVGLEQATIPGYHIVNELHRGGQGVVYKAQRNADQSTVAIKTLLNGVFSTSRQQRRFEREIELVGGLHQDNIVRIFDSGVTSDHHHYLVMEFIDGQPLDRFLHGTNGRPRPASVHAILEMFRTICSAVEHAHRHGVIHRDLKPSNILVDASGKPHIVDFGLAKTLENQDSAATLPGEFMGTFAYASPEQLKSDPEQIDTRSDVYSLGVILYQMLTRQLPHDVRGSMSEALKRITEVDPDPPSSSRPAVNDEIDTIVLKALSKEPGRRYQTVAALREDVDNYLSGKPINAKRDSSWYVLSKMMRRQRSKIAACILGFLLVVSVGAALFFQHRAERVKTVDTPYNEALTFQRKLSWDRAAGKFEAVLDIDPDHFGGLVNLAIVKKELYYHSDDPQDLDDASRLLTRAARLRPERKEVWNLQSIVERIRGNFHESLVALDRAIEIDEEYYPMWVNRGLVNALLLDLEEAEADMVHGLELANRPIPMALHNLAAVEHELGRPDALVHCNQALLSDLGNTAYRLLRCKLTLAEGEEFDPRAALSDAITADQLTPAERPHSVTKRMLAFAYLRNDDWEGAARAAEAALEIGDPMPHAHLIWGLALARNGDHDDARQHLQSALEAMALFKRSDLVATDDDRFVWFDGVDDAQALRDELEQMLGPP